MRWSSRWLVGGSAAGLLVLAGCQDTPSPAGPELPTQQAVGAPLLAAPGQVVPGRYIVVFKPGVKVASLKAPVGVTVLATWDAVLNGYVADATPAGLTALQANPFVAYVEPDQVVTADATQSGATWGLDRIDQRALPLSTTYVYNATGTGVTAYIIDTGILGTHTQFTGRMVGGFTAISDGRGTTDCNGHGTHVAGTVGGTTHGVAKQVKLSPVRVLDCGGSGTTSGVISGVNWVAKNRVKPAVANLSLGGGYSASLNQAVAAASDSGVTMVVAAGNSNANACNYSPSSEPKAITVGATTSTDARSSFSNVGTCLDLFAPGSSITSAYYTSTTATATMSGTSMASPHVAGAAALYLQGATTATPSQVASALTSNATAGVVTGAGTGSPNRLLFTGFIGGTQSPPPQAAFTYSCDVQRKCTFDGSSSTGTGLSYRWTSTRNVAKTGVSVVYWYDSAGTYTVTLTVTDNVGRTSSTSKTFTLQ